MFDRRGMSMLAATVMLATTALAATADSGAQAAIAAGATAKTTLHIHVAGCDSCTIQLQQALQHPTKVWQTSEQKVGSDHVATFTVPTTATHGVSFVVRAPWEKNTDAITNVVTAYAGQKVGSAVSGTSAGRARQAAGCWAGTTLATEDLDVQVSKIQYHAGSTDVIAALAYAPHTLASEKPFVGTDHGAIGNQDAFYCSPSKS